MNRAQTDRTDDGFVFDTHQTSRTSLSTHSVSYDGQGQGGKIAPALLRTLQQQPPLSPGKLGAGLFAGGAGKFGDNTVTFMKHRASARMSRIISGNVDKVEDLVEKDNHLLNAHEYLAGLEKKRATLTLKQSSTVHANGGKVGGHVKTASLMSSKSVPASKAIKFRRVETKLDLDDNESNAGTDAGTDVGTPVGHTSDATDEDEYDLDINGAGDLSQVVNGGIDDNKDDITRPSQMVTSEQDGFDLAEFGKLVDSNLTAGLEFAVFMRDNPDDDE